MDLTKPWLGLDWCRGGSRHGRKIPVAPTDRASSTRWRWGQPRCSPSSCRGAFGDVYKPPNAGWSNRRERNMKQEPGGRSGGVLPLLGGGLMVLCCGLPLLLASGALSAVSTWFLDGAWIWLAAVPVLIASGLHFWRQAGRREQNRPANSSNLTGAAAKRQD